VLRVDLRALEAGEVPRVRAWCGIEVEGLPPGALERIGSWGGAALGLAWLAAHPETADAFLLAAGDAVRRALPTAARATVLARSPSTGRLSEGQIGGDLGLALARHADLVVLQGRTRLPGAVLVLAADGALRIEAHPELAGASPVATWRVLAAGRAGQEGSPAILSIGAAGEALLPFASLAGGGERPSFVGRGGLGAVFGALGLKAFVVHGRSEAGDGRGRRELLAALTSSPRLSARAGGGTFELYGSFAARGDLRGRNYAQPVSVECAEALFEETRARGVERKGCAGCPTPCGWVFERSDGSRQRAHFSASYALGTNLGLETFDDSLELLALCDELAIDAKETGALLALLAEAQAARRVPGEPVWGDRERLGAAIRAIVAPSPAEPFADLARGALSFARRHGLEQALCSSRGEVARPEQGYAAVLGQCVSTGGTDPMRSFPFLVDAAGRERLEELCADLGPLPREVEDPSTPAAKGRLVYWHENLVSAVNAVGFCAFSTAGVLADGLCTLDRLAEWILPRELREPDEADWDARAPGERLLAAGASLVLLRRFLDARGGAPPDDRPAWAREQLEAPGMLDEYRAWRGLDPSGRPAEERIARLGTPFVLAAPPLRESPTASPARAPRATSASGASASIELRALGSLREVVGPRATVELPLPATVLDVLHELAARDARLARGLFDGPRPIPAVWRAGRRLAPEASVRAGDVLDLVTAIGGG